MKEDLSRLVVCECSTHGSTGLHRDERPTVVLIEDRIYDLVQSSVTYQQLLDLPAAELPHVRHLNPIPHRTREEQRVKTQISPSVFLERVKVKQRAQRAQRAKDNIPKEVETKPEEKSLTRKKTVKGDSMAKEGKIQKIVESLKERALTVDDMIAMGVSRATAATLQYFLKRKGYGVDKIKTETGAISYKIVSSPAMN